MIQARFQEAIRHPSQVVSLVRHLLYTPLPSLLDMHDHAKRDLRNDLLNLGPMSQDRSGWQEEPMTPLISGRSRFTLKPDTLWSVEIVDCRDFVVDLERIQQHFGTERPKYAITIRNCRNFAIRGGHFFNARNVCIIENSEGFTLSRLNASESEGYGLIVFNSRKFEIAECTFMRSLASGIYCLGETSNGWIHDNVCQGGVGQFNWDAGIHINHCTPSLGFDQVPELSHEDKRIVEKTRKPTLLFVENNLFSNNRAQGIYCEGTILCSFEGNVLYHNNKEGICLDWGSALNLFRGNTVIENGDRAGLTEADIKADFIEHFPLLDDGSSSCKLPGLSIDNGAVNFITRNRFHGNFGGGIKMVRTGIANLIFDNAILDNAVGRNAFFPRYNGVYLLAMGVGGEFSPADAKLDFYPSEHNLCFRNTFSVDPRDSIMASDEISTNNFESGNVNIDTGVNADVDKAVANSE